MVPSSRRRAAFLLSILLCGVTAIGCGGSKTGSLSGHVKFKGELLPAGTITFLSQGDDKQVVAADIKDGSYAVPKMAAGPVLVTVTTNPPSKGGLPPGGAKPIERPGASGTPTGKYVPLPKRYADSKQAGLGFDVKSGSQTKDFDLTP